jgi:bifunctional N-acetylglucosamine-1-phosphate-uridyltransferase/glucosamine-1-phosphate-acetyltransferase GlmU-like protein
MKKIAAVILAAGRGKRIKAQKINKVMFPLGDKQMILHATDLLDDLDIDPIIVVVGFAKESIMKILDGKVIFANQSKRLGTAHAVSCAMKKLPENIQTILVLNGDDSAFYNENIVKKLIKTHINKNAALSFLTITVDNPIGLGRIMRDGGGKVIGVVEENDATGIQKKINEINPACYVFEVNFLKKYLKQVKKSPVSGEYYLTSMIDIAIKNKQKIEAVEGGKILWRGINTPQELEEAKGLFLSQKEGTWE